MNLASLVIATAIGSADVAAPNQQWRVEGGVDAPKYKKCFPTRSGRVDVILSRLDNSAESSVIFLSPESDALISEADELAVVEKTINDMRQNGFDYQKLATVKITVAHSPYRDGLAQDLFVKAHSQACTHLKYCWSSKGDMERYLSKIDAYSNINEMLRRFDLKITGYNIDEPAVGVDVKYRKVVVDGILILNIGPLLYHSS